MLARSISFYRLILTPNFILTYYDEDGHEINEQVFLYECIVNPLASPCPTISKLGS